MRFYSQNLMLRDVPGTYREEVAGPIWRHGRCWLSIGRERRKRKGPATLGFEWQVPSPHVGVSVEVGGAGSERDLSAFVGCGLFALWAHLEDVFPRNLKYRKGKHGKYVDDREISLSCYMEDGDARLRWELWRDSSSWSTGTPRWRSGSWAPLDTLLDSTEYSERDQSRHIGAVYMPEGRYPVTIRFFESTWKRPRWPWPRVIVRADAEFETPIPFPGKGESDWDQGEDGYSSMTLPAATPEQAIAGIVESVLRQRRRHGGSVEWALSQAAV